MEFDTLRFDVLKCSLGSLIEAGKVAAASDLSADAFARIKNLEVTGPDAERLVGFTEHVGVTAEFNKVIETFKTESGVIPAGFRPRFVYGGDKCVRVDLYRDISYAENGKKRPTNVLYSANTANPFHVVAMKNLIANLTTNPQLIYQHFLNNPNVNKGGQFKDRYEVLAELCRLVGPGVDISVEVNNPFASENEIMEEIKRCEEVLTPYRLVVKIPHTGALNKDNVPTFLEGKLDRGHNEGTVEESFYGHNLAYKLSQLGYRVNFTLMFDPHQTALALQARPYFINAFVEMRYVNSLEMKNLLAKFDKTGDAAYAEQIRNFLLQTHEWPLGKKDAPAADVVHWARQLVEYREIDTPKGFDGLDSVRYSLRWLRQSNLPDTRLIVCNTKLPKTYWDIDKMLTEPEFADMTGRVVLTCDPNYFAQFTGAAGIYYYQKSFLESAPK